MKTKHLSFEIIEEKPKTKVFEIISNFDGNSLGTIYWYPKWRQYVFQPIILEENENTIWSNDCLRELLSFLDKLKEERKDVIKYD